MKPLGVARPALQPSGSRMERAQRSQIVLTKHAIFNIPCALPAAVGQPHRAGADHHWSAGAAAGDGGRAGAPQCVSCWGWLSVLGWWFAYMGSVPGQGRSPRCASCTVWLCASKAGLLLRHAWLRWRQGPRHPFSQTPLANQSQLAAGRTLGLISALVVHELNMLVDAMVRLAAHKSWQQGCVTPACLQ